LGILEVDTKSKGLFPLESEVVFYVNSDI